MLDNVELDLVQSVSDAEKLLRWLGERREYDIVGIDLETGQLPGQPTKYALSPWHGQIRLAQIGDMHQGWAIPWDRWAGVFYEAVNRYRGRFVIHNVGFEGRWFGVKSDWKMPWHRIEDSMIAAQVIDPTESAALKVQTAKYVDPRAAAMQGMLDQKMSEGGWDWGTIPVEVREYWLYGALDPVITCHLWNRQQQFVGVNSPYRIPYELEMATRRVCTQMELAGARVDLDYAQHKYDELRSYADNLKSWGKSVYGINIASGAQLIKIFENKLGAEITELTPRGNKRVDKDQLKKFTIDGSPEVKNLAQSVLNMRKAEKLAETYLANAIQDQVDGLLHANIRTMGARTGRMSITSPGPALQTLPKKDTTIRTAFLPRDPENEVLLSSDLDQVEFRMTASLSNDPGLIQLFLRCDAEGGDSFTEIMREIYADPSLQKKDPRRGLVKGTVYGKLYGAGVDKMALTAGVPSPQMRSVVEAFDSQYPGVKQFARRIVDEGMRHKQAEGIAYINTHTGRRLPASEGKEYALTNYRIQGGAAEVFKTNLLKCDAAGLTPFFVVPVHDEIVLSVPKNIATEVGRVLKECMTTTEGWVVPLTAGLSQPLSNWGENSD